MFLFNNIFRDEGQLFSYSTEPDHSVVWKDFQNFFEQADRRANISDHCEP